MERENKTDAIVINEVQLLLAEKRTSLAVMRTGIAILALPLSIISLLIATSKYYDLSEVLHLASVLGVLMAGLIILGIYLVTRSILKLHTYDRHIHQLKLRYSAIGDYIE